MPKKRLEIRMNLTMIRTMRRPIERLLALLLALLLGFSPLQTAWASTATGQPGGNQQSMADHVRDTHPAGHQAGPRHQSCCQAHACCQDHSGNAHCGSSHCASCLSLLLVHFSAPTPPTLTSSYVSIDAGSPSQRHTVILRPPRV